MGFGERAMLQPTFRSFHSLVQRQYIFNSPTSARKVASMLTDEAKGLNFHCPLPEHLGTWRREWMIQYWSLFFGENQPALNRTGFSPSFAFLDDKRLISLLDFDATQPDSRFGFLRMVRRAKIRKFYKLLDETLGTGTKFQDWSKNNKTPVMLQLLIDGFIDNPDSEKLGPVASEIFRMKIEKEMREAKSIVLHAIKHFTGGLDPRNEGQEIPDSFVKLANSIN